MPTAQGKFSPLTGPPPLTESYMGLTFTFYAVVEGSPQRRTVYEDNLKKFSVQEGKTALRAFSDTRWTARADYLAPIVSSLPALFATLQELRSIDKACEGPFIRIGTLDFLLKVLILKECFNRSR